MSAKAWFPCLLSAFVALLFGAGEAQACSCGRTPSVLREYEWADAVVIARADAVEKARPGEESGSGGIRSTTLTVEKVYKGNFKPGDPFSL
ncbi:MAG TPA: hypothetical protein VEQ42_00710 [Pyrinomonadaceae bacterium]|nr:hypothetical protein [Pyrinomonadaceae bacterium]